MEVDNSHNGVAKNSMDDVSEQKDDFTTAHTKLAKTEPETNNDDRAFMENTNVSEASTIVDDGNQKIDSDSQDENPPFEEADEEDISERMKRTKQLIIDTMFAEIPAHELRGRFELLEHPLSIYDNYYNGFDVEFDYIEKESFPNQDKSYNHATTQNNRAKNRYLNVLPPDETRVLLEKTDKDGDYINANWISGLIPATEKAYIATQGPLQSTTYDFWRMIDQYEVEVIVMLTKEIENGRFKCDRYWPEKNEPLKFEDSPLEVHLMEETSNTELITRRLRIDHKTKNTSREVVHFQYYAWPDHGLPVSTAAFLDLALKTDDANKKSSPVVVHCSAGIGRSGTFCAVHSTLEKLKHDIKNGKSPSFNLVKEVLRLRKMRPGMVQTKEQYMFCYLTFMEEADRLLPKEPQTTEQNSAINALQKSNHSLKQEEDEGDHNEAKISKINSRQSLKHSIAD